MAIVGEPCNADVHAKIHNYVVPMLCEHMYCTVYNYTH